MKLNCSIVDDLLPLYLENDCSEESKVALEEHLKECLACRKKLARMKETNIIPQAVTAESEIQLTNYVKKVKRHRIRIGIVAILISVLSACILSLCFLTIKDMRTQANPIVYTVEDGVYNLTSADLKTTAADVGNYILFTNNSQIKVSIQERDNIGGELLLWNAKDNSVPILYGNIDSDTNTCTFTGLSSANRYRLTYSGTEETVITISEGRVVSFWSSLQNVLSEIFVIIQH